MSIQEIIVEKLESLPLEKQREVLDFVEFLVVKTGNNELPVQKWPPGVSALTAAQEFVGCVEGPEDLSTNTAKGTLDPEILLWCEEYNFILVTNNRKSMPVHLADNIAQTHHIPGIFILNSNLSIGQNIDELIIIAEGSFEGEYQDQIIHLPITKIRDADV